MIPTIRRAFACVMVAVCATTGAHAFEVTVDAPDNVAADMRTGSLTAALIDGDTNGETPGGIDVLSAAQADYGRLIGVLYELGYFAPTISIRVDGREAASISPVAAPAAISNVVIKVEPGAVFTFGTVSISPEAPTSEPVPDLMPGKTA
ncbi:MAG: hypothetical protein AAF252_10890, partial [Pseudomonadota bacterium]